MSAIANLGIGFIFLTMISALWTIFFGTVDTLPFGMEEVLQIFSNSVNSTIQIIPLLETPYQLLIWAIKLKVSLIVVMLLLYFVNLVRG